MVKKVSANNFEVLQPKAYVSNVLISYSGLGYSNGNLSFSSSNGNFATGTYEVDNNGSIIHIKITDYGRYYTTTPTVVANGSNTIPASLVAQLDQYANNTSGNVNVHIFIV
jgi:hypothetical protein